MKNIRYIISAVALIMSAAAYAQDSGEIPIPLSDPSKRMKLKAYINYGSITVKGTARKDVLVKYSSRGESDDNHERSNGKNAGLKRIGGGTMDLEVAENANFVNIKSDSWSTKIN